MVRLSDLVNQVRRKVSEGTNFARNPLQMIRQRAFKGFQQRYKQADLPFTGQSPKQSSTQSSSQKSQPLAQPTSEPNEVFEHPLMENGQQYDGSSFFEDEELQTFSETYKPDWADHGLQKNGQEADKVESLFPEDLLVASHYPDVLQMGEVLQRGWWGRYTIGKCCQDQGWMRLYEGTQENGNEPVWIYEYCLSEDIFETPDIDQRKRWFKQLVDLNLHLGDGSDFRILKPKDVIASSGQTCYLITKSLPGGQLLAETIAIRRQPISTTQIRCFFEQVLQSLQYLQTYRVNWPDETSTVGLPHGSLGMESLWLRFSEVPTASGERPFFVYLSRLALWEHLFYPGALDAYPLQTIAQNTSDLGSLERDFEALGRTGFAWIVGDSAPGDPTDKNLWPQDSQIRTFYPFICQLLGQGPEGPFKSVEVAIAALRNLSAPEVLAEEAELAPEPQPSFLERQQPVWALAFLGLVLLGLGGLILRWVGHSKPGNIRIAECQRQQTCRLNDIEDWTNTRALNYAFEPGSYWAQSFFRTLTSPLESGDPLEPLFEQVLEDRDTSLNLQKSTWQVASRDDLLRQITDEYAWDDEAIDVGFIRTVENISSMFSTQVIAYDGISVFVAYSDSQRTQSIPGLLNGKISLTQLRQLFLGQMNQIGQYKVKLYFPQDSQITELFRDLLFQTAEEKAQFDRQHLNSLSSSDLDHGANRIYSQMLGDFESNTGDPIIGIGFDRISQMFGQCSVYPLALSHQGKTYSVLVDAEGNPIDIDTDLCGDKGTYWVNSNIFNGKADESYPLGYAMAVVYPACDEETSQSSDRCKGGESLANKLLTAEGQYLLSETGLVPKTPISEIRQTLWEGGGYDTANATR